MNDAKACVLRELNEELALCENDIENLSLRYVTLRRTKGEIRQNYYFFANLKENINDDLHSNEGLLKCFPINDIGTLEMPYTAKYVMEHYCEKGLTVSNMYSPYMMWIFAKHKDSFVRSNLAKALVYDTKSSVALDILCKLAKDKDSLVRVEAVDSLSEYFCEKSYKALKNALYDSDYLVRKYALFGIAYTGQKLCPQEAIAVLYKHRENDGFILDE